MEQSVLGSGIKWQPFVRRPDLYFIGRAVEGVTIVTVIGLSGHTGIIYVCPISLAFEILLFNWR